jgi:hypothetical protein
MAVLSIPWATGIGMLSFAAPSGSQINPLIAAALSWLVMVTLGSCALALMTRFELEQLLGVPVVGLVVLSVLVPRLFRAMFPHISTETVQRLLSRPGAFLIVAALLAIGSAAVVATAFQFTKQALASYQRDAAMR